MQQSSLLKNFSKLLVFIFLLSLFASCYRPGKRGIFGLGGYHKLKEAEELSRQKKYDEAIEAYREHMQDRIEAENRPEWENPYFYYLLIGDMELGRGNVDEALKSYALAEGEGIHVALISDRYRFVAAWYEEQGEYEKAIELLKKHRVLDELLFDAVMDRISKTMLSHEQATQTPAATPSATPTNVAK